MNHGYNPDLDWHKLDWKIELIYRPDDNNQYVRLLVEIPQVHKNPDWAITNMVFTPSGQKFFLKDLMECLIAGENILKGEPND